MNGTCLCGHQQQAHKYKKGRCHAKASGSKTCDCDRYEEALKDD